MDLKKIRGLIVTALFSDELLLDRLVLKGGNALELIYGIGMRGSVDLDFSIERDFTDFEETRNRIVRALRDRFDSAGFVVFDEKFERRPPTLRAGQPEGWGGYRVEFKIIEKEKHSRLNGRLDALRREAHVTDDSQTRTFQVDISKNEFCRGKAEVEFQDSTVYVYTPEMLAIEKLRAICQQLPEYVPISRALKRARARDFFDIRELIRAKSIDLTTQENLELLRAIFAAKEVPLPLLGLVKNQREFHRIDWPSVESSVLTRIASFDECFDFVIELAEQLQASGIK